MKTKLVPKPKKDTQETAQQMPEITINQYLPSGISEDGVAEKTKQALTGMFRQYSMGAE